MVDKAIEKASAWSRKIITSVKSKDQATGQEVMFYATNKHVLRYTKRFRGEDRSKSAIARITSLNPSGPGVRIA